MALFTRFFPNKKRANGKRQENVSDKLFAFSKDQVRIVLFRECDFRGRKLLFDSITVKKVPITAANPKPTEENEKIAEITDGFGYIYTKPQPDFSQLAEMVFGSVAMSFRGTYFKMHSLEAPNRLMLTQVFSSPRQMTKRTSVSSRCDSHTFEHSKLDDSGASSTNSMSEHLSVQSTASDTILVFRHQTAPLDVPPPSRVSASIPSLAPDSGYSHRTHPSFGSAACRSYWRRTSLSFASSTQSARPAAPSPAGARHRCSKLALAFILRLTPGQEEALGQFLTEHVCLLEAVLHRARAVVERAYGKSTNFVSLMVEMARISIEYLVNLLSGACLSVNLWLTLSESLCSANRCDNRTSISAFCNRKLFDEVSFTFGDCGDTNEFNLFNIGRFLRSDWDPFNIKRNFFGEGKRFTAEKFVREFCELLETIDVKDTNFFMSTLLTAVLTHHLGWVGTCLPQPDFRPSCNPLWNELSDLYGAGGHPTKTAQTILTGTNRRDLISKILLTLTYFIRCCDVDRRVPVRVDVDEETQLVETLCRKAGSIPKENFKKYGDHLKEIMCAAPNNDSNNNNSELLNGSTRTGGLKRAKTLGSLAGDGDADGRVAGPLGCCEGGEVVFVLGDGDRLVGLRRDEPKPARPTFLPLADTFNDDDFVPNAGSARMKPSTSWSRLEALGGAKAGPRSLSEPPEERAQARENVKNTAKYRYCGVKFNLKQYPQILSNYMKSKNLEMTHLQFGDKALKYDELTTLNETIRFPEIGYDYEEGEALQTPSNASELEFTSDLFEQAVESCVEAKVERKFVVQHVPNTTVRCDDGKGIKMRIAVLPMPKLRYAKPICQSIRYTSSLMRGACDDYMPDMVLQAPMRPKACWEGRLKSDLVLAGRNSLLDQPIGEAVAILANVDSWEVQIMSNRSFIIDKSSSGMQIGMSQLVSNMLESLLKMWKLNVSPQYCLLHIEQTLQELCVRSKALAELLLASEFCSMEQLTSTLQLEVNDVPLLLAVASTHSPQVTQKYGLSFQ